MAASKNVPSINGMVEIPKGSRNKYEYDTKRGVIKFDRVEGWEGLDSAPMI